MRPPMPSPQFPYPQPELLPKGQPQERPVGHAPMVNQHHPLHAMNNQFKGLNIDPVSVQGATRGKPDQGPVFCDDTFFSDEESNDDEEEEAGDEPYLGWSLYRGKPASPGQEPDWSRVTKSRMNLTQEDLGKLVKEQKKGSVAKIYSNLGRLKRQQIDDLIEELKRKDSRFNLNVVYIKAITKDVNRWVYVTTTIHLVLEKTLKPGASLSPRLPRKQSPRFQDDIPFERKEHVARGPPFPGPFFHGHPHNIPQPHIFPENGQTPVQRFEPVMLPNAGMGGVHGAQNQARPQQQQQQPPPPPPPPPSPPQRQPHPQQYPQLHPHVHPQAQPQPRQPIPHPQQTQHQHQQQHERMPSQNGGFPAGHSQLPPGVHVINGPSPRAHPHNPPPPMARPQQTPISHQIPKWPSAQKQQVQPVPEIVHLGKVGPSNEKHAADQWTEVDSSNGDDGSELFDLAYESSETDDSFQIEDFEIKTHKHAGSRRPSKGRAEPEPAYRIHRRPSPKYPAPPPPRDAKYNRVEVDVFPAKNNHREPFPRSASVSRTARPALKIVYGDRTPGTPVSSRGISPLRYADLADKILLQKELEDEERKRRKELTDYIWTKRMEAKEDSLKRRERDLQRREKRVDQAERPRRRLSSVDSFERFERKDRDRRPRVDHHRQPEMVYHGAERRR
ncbi:hypothetical protein PRK78_006596 [Emydomyces testavorans]|uniref:Uncharacterized protein n=1 Tax=Emydomyces testavorans TaxID=2070801 RepID=A0AAF0ILU9_9EURO|nr:hypothetical protein PRK78_006596 [Emydomyces testavorans]